PRDLRRTASTKRAAKSLRIGEWSRMDIHETRRAACCVSPSSRSPPSLRSAVALTPTAASATSYAHGWYDHSNYYPAYSFYKLWFYRHHHFGYYKPHYF